jgi:hypothetical protein
MIQLPYDTTRPNKLSPCRRVVCLGSCRDVFLCRRGKHPSRVWVHIARAGQEHVFERSIALGLNNSKIGIDILGRQTYRNVPLIGILVPYELNVISFAYRFPAKI